MKMIIWGSEKDAVAVYDILKDQHKVIAFGENNLNKVGENLDGIPIISNFKAKSMYHESDDSIAIVIPGSYFERTIKDIVSQLIQDDIVEEDIYIVPLNAVRENRYELVQWNSLVQLYLLQLKISLHCNLNCKRCGSFSNLYDESFYELDQFEKDIERLHSLVSNIRVIQLIGGEPLLNPQITEYVRLVRKYYPHSHLVVVTNGILIPQLADEVWECFRNNNVYVSITLYPVMVSKIDDIMQKVKKENVQVYIFRNGDEFGSILNMEGTNDTSAVEGNLFFGRCNAMYHGEISRCSPILLINKFNAKFNVALPDNGKINLYNENLDGSKLVSLLNQSADLCKYCNGCIEPYPEKQLHKWERDIKGQSQLEDWLV